MKKFCCKSTVEGVFGVDITFSLCDLWITDTSYRNKRVLYEAGNYCLSPEYMKFQVASHVWHSWNEERKSDHSQSVKFKAYVPNISDTSRIPANAGRKPSYQQRERERNTTEPDIMVDHTQKSASRDSPHRRESLKNIIAQISQSRSQNAWEIGVDQ